MLTMQFAGRFESTSGAGLTAVRAHLDAMDQDYERAWSLSEEAGGVVLRPLTFGSDECRAGGLWEQLDEICQVATANGVRFTGEIKWLREDYCDDAEGTLGGWVVMVDGRPEKRPLPLPLGPDAAPWWNMHEARKRLALPAPEGMATPEEMDARWARRR